MDGSKESHREWNKSERVKEALYEVKWSESHSVMSNSLWPWGLYSPWNSLGQNKTGVGWHFLLQGIFPTQGSNPGLSHCRQILYQLSHKGSPNIIYYHLYLESRKLYRWTYFQKKNSHGYRKETYSYKARKGEEGCDELGGWNWHIYNMYKVDD